MRVGQRTPVAQGDAVARGRGEAAGFGGRLLGDVAEDIAGIAQLRQHHEPRARIRRLGYGAGGGLAVGLGLTYGDRELCDRDHGGRRTIL